MQNENQENNSKEQTISIEEMEKMFQMQQGPAPLTDEQKEKHKDLIGEIMRIQTPMVELQVKLSLQMKEVFKEKEKNSSPEELLELQQVIIHCEEELQNIFYQKMSESGQ